MKHIFLSATCLCFIAFNSLAASAINKEIDLFVGDYYRAYQKNDVEALRALTHPLSLQCLDKVAPDYFNQDLSLDQHLAAASPPVWKSDDIKPVLSSPESKRFPVMPTTAIQVSWSEGTPFKGSTFAPMVALVSYKGEYVQVLACMDEKQVSRRNAFFARRKTEH